MSNPADKRPRLRLDTPSYVKLHRGILKRDGWKCQHCGGRKNLQVHHIQSRSLLGDDVEDNLITVCVQCHERIHRKH